MSGQSSGQSLFSRKRASSDEPPADDPVKAPYGWMKDKKTGKWRPRKSWGGAGRNGRKVAGQPGGATTPDGLARKTTARKRPAKGRSSEPLRMVEPLAEDDAGSSQEDDDLSPFLGADPAPSWHDDDAPNLPVSPDDGKTDLRTEVESWIALGWSLPADVLATIDPYCFGPLVDDQTGPLIVSCFADIAMQSPKVAAFIADKAGLMPYIKLGFAFKPVVANAWRHHISKKVEVEVDREQMTYTVTPKDYSQYPAA